MTNCTGEGQIREKARHGIDRGADWWVGQMSHSLGIVDRHGVIALESEETRQFKREFTKRKKAL